MDNTARLIDLALAETLITQKDTYSREEYQNYKYVLLQCIIGESVIGSNNRQNFHYFTRSNRSRIKIMSLGQNGLIIELIKNAIKYDAYIYEKTWCRFQCPSNLSLESNEFNSTNVVPFIVREIGLKRVNNLISAMKNNRNLCESSIASFVETRYERGLFNSELDEIYLKSDEHVKLMNELNNEYLNRQKNIKLMDQLDESNDEYKHSRSSRRAA